jgi:hypothetical protein
MFAPRLSLANPRFSLRSLVRKTAIKRLGQGDLSKLLAISH